MRARRNQRLIAPGIAPGLISLLLLVLSGCGSSPPERKALQTGPSSSSVSRLYKVGKPYQIKGVWYYPQIDYDYVEEGVASWYGPGFHGQTTANGEIYDMNDMTAAHRTLPLPSIVRVTNLENGRSIKLKVNDRGPFARNRILDVSRRAAQLLGFYGAGTALVRVEIEAEESRQLAVALTGTDFPAGAQVASRQAPAPTQEAVIAPQPIPTPEPDVVSEPVAPEPVYVPTPEPLLAANSPIEPAPPAAISPTPAPTLAPEVDPAVGDAAVPPYAPPMTYEPPVTDEPPVTWGGAHPAVSGDGMHAAPRSAEPAAINHPPAAATSASHFAAKAPASSPPTIGETPFSAGDQAYIQAGAFALPANAERARSQLKGLGPVAVTPSTVSGRGLYRVRVGPFGSFEEAERLLARVVRSGFPGSHVVIE